MNIHRRNISKQYGTFRSADGNASYRSSKAGNDSESIVSPENFTEDFAGERNAYSQERFRSL